jgi:serine/threonine protein kinase/lipoprotein NlpI
MAEAWRNGRHRRAEDFLADHPELRDQPAAILRVIYEEICLREAAGEEVAPLEVVARFPAWHDELNQLLGVHRLLDARPVAGRLPEVGSEVGGFRLISELGRGARGRVYLATQNDLADRPVVLKIVPGGGEEHLTLARLHHTHIIPIDSVQDLPGPGLVAICMPYLGGTTLERLLEDLAGTEPASRTGAQLLDALDRASAASPIAVSSRGPARRFLARSSYDRAVVWIGACLADALCAAHERGLLHLDIKPSNVLLAADGQPLLLDFHLARAPILPGGPAPAWIGGTPAYMTPEQAATLQAIRDGTGPPVVVDGRSDVYSLGRLLSDALGRTLPRSGAGTRADVGRGSSAESRLAINPNVSRGLDAILRKCRANEPRDRYADAAALATDLRRHLADLPLLGVANRSLSERLRKLRRRQPHAPALFGMLLVVIMSLLVVGGNVVAHMERRRQTAARDLVEGRAALGSQHYQQAERSLARGVATIEGLPGAGKLLAQLDEQLRLAHRGAKAGQLHAVADRVRFLFGTEAVPAASPAIRTIAGRCRTLWEARDRLLPARGTALSGELERQLRIDLLDLVVLWTDLHVMVADTAEKNRARREALLALEQAEALLPPSALLFHARGEHARILGRTALASAAARRAGKLVPRTPWEHQALGLALLRSGAFAAASDEFRRVLDANPRDFWANYFDGVCSFRIDRYADAEGAFRVCVALAPTAAECFFNRARARQALGQDQPSRRDYDRALELDPALAGAALNRGILHYDSGRFPHAEADLKRALQLGADAAMVYYNLALNDLARDEPEAARADINRALRQNPEHPGARELQQRHCSAP